MVSKTRSLALMYITVKLTLEKKKIPPVEQAVRFEQLTVRFGGLNGKAILGKCSFGRLHFVKPD